MLSFNSIVDFPRFNNSMKVTPQHLAFNSIVDFPEKIGVWEGPQSTLTFNSIVDFLFISCISSSVFGISFNSIVDFRGFVSIAIMSRSAH